LVNTINHDDDDRDRVGDEDDEDDEDEDDDDNNGSGNDDEGTVGSVKWENVYAIQMCPVICHGIQTIREFFAA
jgi:hypothetical protein